MTDKKYNGYANYETWAVTIWLENDECSYRYWHAAARQERREAPDCRQVREALWPADRAATYRLADRIKREVLDGAPELGPNLYADLLNTAFDEVDWHEVAENFLEE